MKKIKKTFIKMKPYVPFILLLLFYLVMTSRLGFISDDAINHNKTYENGMINYLISSYNHWSSRIFIYFINSVLYMLPMFIWKLLNAIVVVIGAKCVSILFNNKKDIKIDYIICILVALFPFASMSSAGYIASSLTYYWPIVFALICLIPIKKIDDGKKINWFLIPIYSILLLYATDCEQLCLVLFGISIVMFIYFKYIKKEKVNPYIYYLFIFTLLKIIFIKTCPGNESRTLSEMNNRFPEFNEFTLFDKLYIGILYTMHILKMYYILPVISSILLCIITNKNNKKFINKIIANINMVLVLLFTIFEKIIVIVVPKFSEHLNTIDAQILTKNHDVNYITLAFIFLIITSFIYLIYINFKKNLLPTLIILAGLFSQMVMSFSPTIYASAARTGSILYYSFILLNLYLLKDLKIKDKYMNWIYSLLLIFMLLQFVNFI